MWQGAEQEYATGSPSMDLFESLGETGVFSFKQDDGIPRAFLWNGGLCYIHSNLFELCTPECRNPLEIVAYDKACEAYARLASWRIEEKTGKQIHVYKTNIALDPKGPDQYTTIGCHENYLVERTSYMKNQNLLLPFLILRQIFVGAGGIVNGDYLLSPRTIFPKKLFSETSTDYPIISTRDESHTYEDYTRAHIVNGEGARSEYTTFLKHSITGYVLQAIGQNYLKKVPEIDSPLETNKAIATNIDGDWGITLKNGETIKVTDYLNSYYLSSIEELFSDNSPNDYDKKALKEYKWVVEKLDSGLFESLEGCIEWVIKKNLAENAVDYIVNNDLSEEAAGITLLNQYMAVTDPFYDQLVNNNKIKTVVNEEEIEQAFYVAPPESRGYLRVELAKALGDSVKTISWSYLKLKPMIRYHPFTFNELNGWTDEKIKKLIDEISFFL
jgi:proteasome accessory factor A